MLFLQGKLKELKKHPWVSCKAKVFIRHKQKVTMITALHIIYVIEEHFFFFGTGNAIHLCK